MWSMFMFRCNFIHNDIDVMETNIAQPAAVPQSVIIAVPATAPLFPEPSLPLHLFGSTADSPPQSLVGSPSPSPTTMLFDSAFDVFPGLVGAFPFQTGIDRLYWRMCYLRPYDFLNFSVFFVINLAESYHVKSCHCVRIDVDFFINLQLQSDRGKCRRSILYLNIARSVFCR